MTFLRLTALSLGLFAFAGGSLQAESKSAAAKKAITALAEAKDSTAKAEALDELGKIAQVQTTLVEPALPEIKKALEDKNAQVRKAAATAYGRCDPDPKVAVPIFVKMLKEEKDDEVKTGICYGLAAMGPAASDAGPALREAVKAEKEKSKDGKQTRLQRELSEAAKAIGMKKK